MEYCVILVTVPTAEAGETIAQTLVAERLAACVNRVSGLTSIYRWQGKIEKDQEELLLVKTRLELAAKVADKIKSLHPYKVPEIIALPIVAGAKDYLDWLASETGGDDRL